MLKRVFGGLLVLVAMAVGIVFLAGRGCFGRHEGPGEVAGTPRPAEIVTGRAEALESAATGIGVARPRQILFGDLHVHTTISADAFLLSLPMSQGEGAHPQADACDFARYCSALDFWSINDHAEAITPRGWRETIESIRQCNAVAGDPRNPDTVAFLGWEWTQVGFTPESHYGHKNVILQHTDDERIPTRPIAARGVLTLARNATSGVRTLGLGLLSLLSGQRRIHDLSLYAREHGGLEQCEQGVSVRDLPDDCIETAETPAELFGKLDEWGHDAIVIPHGTAWGFYTPPGSSWNKQLTRAQSDPDRQFLLEVYSGHGDSDEYRDWRGVAFSDDGTAVCPEPSASYLPTCWRAGEIIRERCLARGIDPVDCEARAVEARRNAVAAGGQAHLTVPGARPENWLDAGQCRDCDEPAFNYRPGGSAQYILASRSFEDAEVPRGARFGLMSSSDNHFARAGTGYKEVHRRGMTESIGLGGVPNRLAALLAAPAVEPVPESRPFDPTTIPLTGFQLLELERQTSFFLTGGLIAAHSTGRDRESIWQAMKRREVYGTTGPRILLYFDLLNPPGSRGATLPMGAEVQLDSTPIFRVRAVGSLEQRAGCPDHAVAGLSAARLEHLCKGECYNPAEGRRVISRIEVVRIRPQNQADESVAPLIESPWRIFPCDRDPAGCAVTFEDPDFQRVGRDTVYYVRAIEEPAPAINAANLRCDYDEDGRCVRVHPCSGPELADDDCLASHEPRAWSSPIFIDYRPGHLQR